MPAATKTTKAKPTNDMASSRDARPARCFVFPVNMMFSILLLKFEPPAAPVTPATRQPKQKRTTLRMLDA